MSQSVEQQRRDRLPGCFAALLFHTKLVENLSKAGVKRSLSHDVMGHRLDCIEDHKVKGHLSNL